MDGKWNNCAVVPKSKDCIDFSFSVTTVAIKLWIWLIISSPLMNKTWWRNTNRKKYKIKFTHRLPMDVVCVNASNVTFCASFSSNIEEKRNEKLYSNLR